MVAAWLLLAGGLVLAVDQASKRAVLGSRVRVVLNTRPALGVARRPIGLVALWILASSGAIVVASRMPILQNDVARVGLGAAIGGALSNLIDVLRWGAVVDFVDLRIWPVFNLADAAIVCGIAAALWSAVTSG